MKSSDIIAVHALVRELGYEASPEDVRERFTALSANPAHAVFVSRAEDGLAIGFAHVCRDLETLLSEAQALLESLVVSSEVRGRGIGQELLAAAENWARSQGFAMLRLRSNTKRQDAHRFYLREGYALQKTSLVFSKSLARS